jgi:hypothetical protein
MSYFQAKGKKLLSGLILATFLLVPSTKPLAAATTEFKPQTQQEMIAYLMGVVAQLQAQLEQQKGTPVSSGKTVTTQPNPYFVNLLIQAPSFIARDQATLRGLVYPGSSETIEAWFEYGVGTNLKYRSKVYSSLKSTSGRSSTRSSGSTSRPASSSGTTAESSTRSSGSVSTSRSTVSTSRAPSSSGSRGSSSGGEISFSALIEDLEPDTKYTYRLVAEDEKGYRHYSQTRTFTTVAEAQEQSFSGTPAVDTESVEKIDRSSATISGFVTLNDYDEGKVFFMYGTDRKRVDEIEDFDTYAEVSVLGSSLNKVLIKEEFIGRDTVYYNLSGLKVATQYFYRACLEYDDERKGDSLICGEVESFVTQN